MKLLVAFLKATVLLITAVSIIGLVAFILKYEFGFYVVLIGIPLIALTFIMYQLERYD